MRNFHGALAIAKGCKIQSLYILDGFPLLLLMLLGHLIGWEIID
jgi:hypothetical protein